MTVRFVKNPDAITKGFFRRSAVWSVGGSKRRADGRTGGDGGDGDGDGDGNGDKTGDANSNGDGGGGGDGDGDGD